MAWSEYRREDSVSRCSEDYSPFLVDRSSWLPIIQYPWIGVFVVEPTILAEQLVASLYPSIYIR